MWEGPFAMVQKMTPTDKRFLANKRVRDNITAALFGQLEEEPFYRITITQIASRAQVSRQSFYRNFESKEAVVGEFFARCTRTTWLVSVIRA